MAKDKPVFEFKAEGCEAAIMHPSEAGNVKLLFATASSHDYSVILTPAALSSLEAMLAELREAMKDARPLQ